MTNNSGDIRHLINLMESVSEPPLLEGWLDGLKNKIQGRMGRKAREEMAGRFAKEWYKWLGQTRREGTMDDMVRFMAMRVGFNKDDIKAVLNQFEEETGESVDAEVENAADPEASSLSPSDEKNSVEPNDEDGRPIPDDLNTKLSDYGSVGPVDQETVAKPEREDVIDNPQNYMTRGKLDTSKIGRKLSTLEPGQRLVLGKKAYSLGESIGSLMEDEESPVLDRHDINILMDISAARVNDVYLLNGPENDDRKRAAAQKALDYTMGQRGGSRAANFSRANFSGEAPENTGGRKGSGQYDPKELVDILKAYNYPVTRIESLARKVSRSESISDMSDQDMDELSLIGYAFFRART